MANNKKYNSSLVLSEDYLLVWDLKFTLLEKYIFKIIERSTDGGCSDEEISAALTLRCDEIQYVIRDELLSQFIQGDHSRRTIADDFTGMAKTRNQHQHRPHLKPLQQSQPSRQWTLPTTSPSARWRCTSLAWQALHNALIAREQSD